MDRPALKQMLNDLQNIDAVVVYKLDRMSRSQRDTLTLIEEYFLKNDVDFVSITETLDTSTPFGKAMIGILSVFAQLERETIAERMRIGHVKRAEEGLRGMGGNYDPAGYTRNEGHLHLIAEEADHIQTFYDLYEQYHSITKAQHQLKALGFPVWRFRRYRDILSNKLYCGYVTFAGEAYKGQHEPIISEEQFERVQGLLERHKGHNAYKAKESLFSGLVHCGECGEMYVSYQARNKATGKVYRYYICKARRFPAEYDQKCMNKTWRSEDIEKIIIEELSKSSHEKSTQNKNTKKVNYDKLIKQTDQKIERILNLYAKDRFDEDMLDRQMDSLDHEKKKLFDMQQDQESLKNTISKEKIDQYMLDITTVDFSEKQAMIRNLIDTIVINRDFVEIEWTF